MPQIYDQCVISAEGWQDVLLSEYIGQSWNPSVSYLVTSAEINAYWRNSAITTATFKMYLTQASVQALGTCFPVVQPVNMSAQALVYGSAAASVLTTSPSWFGVVFNSACPVVSGEYYSILWNCTNSYATAGVMFTGENFADYPTAATDTVVHYFATQTSITTTTWKSLSSLVGDNAFRIYGLQTTPISASAGLPGDKTRTAKLVAVAGDRIYTESPAGTMAELTAAYNQINVMEQLDLVPAYQKAFVVNGSALKVIDFVNTRCYTTALGANPPDAGNALTGGTSGAQIVVDYAADIGTGTAIIYGVPQSTAVFTDGETVTGADNDGNAISFVLNSALAATSIPHFYDWTVYGQSATFGELPSSPTLGCLYRGRMVLSGTPFNPHQWYMSRQGNPFDWNYVSADSQSPIAGNNADVGKVGDVILALIPRKDDYLIIGCANSMWLIRGDPAEGGSLDPITLSTGIFGPKSYCWDAEDNLYWFGAGGIYKLNVTTEGWQVEGLTARSIPKLIDDETIDPSQHRITMGYDRSRYGILVSITTVATNANSNYWLDLRTGGIFPESYPANCALACQMFYNADDDAYRKLLIGCADGYIRFFDDAAKVDDNGATDAAISAYVTLGPMPINQDPELEGRMIGGFVTLAGGASGGSFSDTDGCQLNFYRGNDAETVLEDIKDGAAAFNSVAFTGTGRKTKITTKVRGNYIAIKAQTIASEQTWSFEKFVANVKPVRGRVE